MKKSMYWMLTAILVCSLTAAVFSSCSKSDDDGGVTSYSMGFSTMETHTLDALTEMSTIQNAFHTEIAKVNGVQFTGLESRTFLYSGSESNIKAACEKAEASLKNEAFDKKNKYVYEVSKNGNPIYTYTVNALQ
jgi:hypothetical protein